MNSYVPLKHWDKYLTLSQSLRQPFQRNWLYLKLEKYTGIRQMKGVAMGHEIMPEGAN